MKSHQTFDIFNTEVEATRFCENWNARASAYMRKHHPPVCTPWATGDGKEQAYIVWHRET